MRKARALLGICLAVWLLGGAAESSAQGILNDVWFKLDLTTVRGYTTPAPATLPGVWTPWSYRTTVYVRFTGGPNTYTALAPQVYSQNGAAPGTYVANTGTGSGLTVLGPDEDLLFALGLTFREQVDQDVFFIASQTVTPFKIRRNRDGSFRSAKFKTSGFSTSTTLDGLTIFVVGTWSIKGRSIALSKLPFVP